jgi:hypothetical protein
MKPLNDFKKYSLILLMLAGMTMAGCNEDDDVPPEENEEEVITDVTLTFTNKADATDIVTARAKDPDGAGLQALQILDAITLDASKSYTLTLAVENNLSSPGEDITKEIAEEAKDHQFFFSFSNDAFSNPTGDGNIDKASDPLVYNDEDANGNPIGLSTSWTTGGSALSNGTFRIRLQHQPELKSATTGADVGDTDFELTFVLNIQ